MAAKMRARGGRQGPVLGLAGRRRPSPQGALDGEEKEARRRRPRWRLGFASGARARRDAAPGPRRCSPRLGAAGSGGAAAARDVLTCGTAARTRAFPARRPPLRPSPGQPPPPARRHVGRRGQSRRVAARSLLGGKAGALGTRGRAFLGGSKAKSGATYHRENDPSREDYYCVAFAGGHGSRDSHFLQ